MTGQAIPRRPLLLGLAGLVPFWAPALALGFGPPDGFTVAQAALALSAYAAVIVSFLGGIRWGLAVAAPGGRADRHFELSVIPSLIAWISLALPPGAALGVLGIVALGLGPLDRSLVTSGLAPSWFGRLRLILSTGAGVALLLGTSFVMARG